MHIYFSGIGGAGIGPLAQVAKQAGYDVSGSDQQDSQYIAYLKKQAYPDIHIGQSYDSIAREHARKPIDWLVHSSALPADHPELKFCREQNIKVSKRDELINLIVREKKLHMIAIAGTHGKTTTTAMVTWLFKQLGEPVSYLLPAKTSFAEMGEYDAKSKYFIYEADEFDRNFLAFEPSISLITGVSWDHHEIFPTREDYQAAFREFIPQSKHTYIWEEDADYLGLAGGNDIEVLKSNDPHVNEITLLGLYNRLDAWMSVQAAHRAAGAPITKLMGVMDSFPGLSRRMEKIASNLYSDYAHTPEKIRGAMSVASEMAANTGQKLIVVYEPLTDRRQHYMIDDYKDCFKGADKLYWIPSYLAREDPDRRVIPPAELISHLEDPSMAVPMKRDNKLKGGDPPAPRRRGYGGVHGRRRGRQSGRLAARGVQGVKIIQANIWGGKLGQQIIDFLKTEAPDFVCMQEVNALEGRSGYKFFATLDEIKSGAGFSDMFMSPTYSARYMEREISYGNAILSQVPFDSTETIFTHREYIRSFDVERDGGNIRNLQIARVTAEGKPLTILNHHGFHVVGSKEGNDETMRQMGIIADKIKALSGPVILCGDFNLTPNSKSLAPINKELTNLSKNNGLKCTYNQLSKVREVCDYIFVNDGIKVRSFKMSDELISDHKALVMEFSL